MDTNFFTFCLILEKKKEQKSPQVGLEPTKDRSKGQCANHYTTDTYKLIMLDDQYLLQIFY